MNKFITKLAKLTLGLAMAAGVGLAIGSGDKVDTTYAATDTTMSVTTTSGTAWTATDGAKSTFTGSSSAAGSYYKLQKTDDITSTAFFVDLSNDSVSVTVGAGTYGGKDANFNVWLTSGGSTITNTANQKPSSTGNKSYTLTLNPTSGNNTTKSVVFHIGNSSNSTSLYIRLYSISITYKAGSTVQNYVVEFDGNTNTGGSMSNDETSGSTYVTPSCDFTKTGHLFSKWALNSTSGTQYAVGETITGISGKITLYAIWAAKRTITYHLTAGVYTGSTPSSEEVANGGSVTAVSLSLEGYIFDGWATSDGGSAVYSGGATISNITSDLHLYDVWRQDNSVKIAFDDNGSDSSSALDAAGVLDYIVEGKSYVSSISTSPSRVYKGKVGVKMGSSGNSGSFTYNLDTTKTSKLKGSKLYACAKQYNSSDKSFTVSSTQLANPTSVSNDTTEDLDEYLIGAFQNTPSAITISSSARLYFSYIRFEPAAISSYTLTYDENGATGGTIPDAVSYPDNLHQATVASNTGENALVKTGYDFNGWNTSSDGSGTPYAAGASITVPQSGVTLYAQWRAKTSSLTFNLDGGSPAAPTTLVATYGQDMPNYGTAPEKVGHTFDGFYDGVGGTGIQYYTNSLASARTWDKDTNSGTTLYAKWTAIPYKVTFDLQGHGSAIAQQTVSYGGKISKPNNPSTAGYTFGGWYAEDACTNAWDFDNHTVSGDTILYAKWTPVVSNLIFDLNEGSGTAPTGLQATYDAAMPGYTQSKPSRIGYEFNGFWSTKTGNGTQYYDENLDSVRSWNRTESSYTLYARWNGNSYNIIYENEGGDSFDGTQESGYPQTHTYGNDTTLKSASKTGYTFNGWFINSDCSGTALSTLSGTGYTDDITLYAKWTINSYAVTFDVQGHGTAPSDQTIDYGEKVTQPNVPSAAGFEFGGWYTDSACSDNKQWNFSTDTISGETTLYAKWTDIRTVVTLSAEDMSLATTDSDATPIVSSDPVGHTSGYVLTSNNESVATIISNKVHPVAKGTATITVHIESDTTYRYIDATFTVTVSKKMDGKGDGIINFANAEGCTYINDSEVSGEDSQGNTWAVTTVGTSSYTSSGSYGHIGSGNNPATSITFTTSLSSKVTITGFSAKFGGFSGTSGTVTLKIGDSTVGSGKLNGSSDVTINPEFNETDQSQTLTITVTGIAKGVKVYYISYSYYTNIPVSGVSLSSHELNLVPGGTYQLNATVSPNDASNKNVTWSVTDASPSGCVTVSDEGLVTAHKDGEATITVTTENGNKTDSCSVVVATPQGAYVNISSASAIGIVGDSSQEINFSYGGSFSDALGVSKTNNNVNVTLTDNGNGTGKITISFVAPGTTIISFTDGSTPIENEGSTCTVTVVERLKAINKYEDIASSLTYTSSYTGDEVTSDDKSWTVDSDGSQSDFDAKGIHYGTGKSAVQYITLTSDSSYTDVTKVIVNACTASGVSATVSVTVGGVAFGGDPQTLTTSASNYTFNGSKASGVVVITITKSSSSTGALYCKGFEVDYKSNTPVTLANTNAVVQQEVLDFVSTMNSDLAVCSSESLDTTIWGELAEKYSAAKIASHDSELFEEMLKYASSTPRASDGSATSGDSLQNALARYDYILSKYNKRNSVVYEDFLGRVDSGMVSYNSSRILSLINFSNNINTVAIIVIISMVSVTAIGGYFFLRQRKEQ